MSEPQTLRQRTQEINAEYWAAREKQTERVAVAQMCLALASAERVAAHPYLVDLSAPEAVKELAGALEYVELHPVHVSGEEAQMPEYEWLARAYLTAWRSLRDKGSE